MLRFELRLLPVEDAANEAEAKVMTESNKSAEHSYQHLKKLLAHKNCRKHPSAINKIRVFAVKGGDPTAEMPVCCCPDFAKKIR